MAENFLMYKGFPLVRRNKEIYYGNMSDEFVANIRIMSTHKENDLDVADKLKVTLMRTAKDILQVHQRLHILQMMRLQHSSM